MTMVRTLAAAAMVGLLLTVSGAEAQAVKAASVAPAPAAPVAGVSPAMWKVQGTRGTVYLFGTIHVMKKNVSWETPKIEAAFQSSGTLYTEIADLSDDAVKQAQPMILELGMDAAHPLSTKISKEDVAALDAAMKKMGAPGKSAIEPMQPWLVYVTLSILPAVQAGYDPASGVDRVLQMQAKTAGKQVKGFETTAEQMHFLADFPMADQVALLHETLVDLPKAVDQTNEMVEDWEHGKVDKIAALENDELKGKHPELYQKLLVARNQKMAETLSGLLKDPGTGTVFVAVGAAHLAGPDSIQKMLENDGFAATRVE